jgi:hypothetical protein
VRRLLPLLIAIFSAGVAVHCWWTGDLVWAVFDTGVALIMGLVSYVEWRLS